MPDEKTAEEIAAEQAAEEAAEEARQKELQDAIDAKLAEAREQWEAEQADKEEAARQAAAQSAATSADERLVQLQELLNEGKLAEYHKLLLEHAEKTAKEAEERAIQRARSEYGGAAGEVAARQVTDTLAAGLTATGKEYIAKYAPMIDPKQAQDPKVQDLIRRAAKDYEREQTVQRQAVERTEGERPTVSDEDRQVSDMLAKIAAQSSGVDLDKLKLSDKDLMERVNEL